MMFKLKPMLAAFALVAISGQAAAAVVGPSASTGSDLLFFLTDSASKKSYVYDLGYAGNFSPTSASAFNVDITQNATNTGTSAAWTSFIGGVGASWASTAVWTVANGFSAGTQYLGTTINNGVGSTLPAVQDTNVQNSVGQFAKLFGTGSALNAPGKSFFGSATGTTAAALLNPANVLLNTTGKVTYLGTNLPFDASNAVGASGVRFTQFLQGGTATPSGTFSFNGTTLSFTAPAIVAAVPEPESWAMMLAGLLMVGSIARRRRPV
jgi:hypothetical protein